MCGISGLLETPGKRPPEDYKIIARQMADRLSHRGPDDSGVWCDPATGIALGHQRLAILDLSREGHQPMHSGCGRYVTVFNGEIYNFQSLRHELERKGHRFRGNSDTEVMLAAFSKWGISEALSRLNGMFALAIWDRQKRDLELVRDRLGQKPLYYGWVKGTFLFASELKAFYSFPGFTPTINREALTLLFRRGCIAAPYSIFKDVYKLKPGCRIRLNEYTIAQGHQDIVQEPYWSATQVLELGATSPFTGNKNDAVDTLEQLLRDAVKICMVSDVPLGAFLSGGIDSSTIVALMQAQSTTPVRTFSIGFWEKQYDEAQHAAQVTAYLGTEHTELYVTEQDALDVIPKLPHIYDEPFADSSQIPTYLVSKLARQHVTVALSGDGGDELFCGYPKYHYFDRVRHFAHLPEPLLRAFIDVIRYLPFPDAKRWPVMGGEIGNWSVNRSFREKFKKLANFLETARSPEDMYIHIGSIWKTPAELVLGAAEPPTLLTTPAEWPRRKQLVRRVMGLDTVTYLPDDILVKVDRAAMAVSLETRIPLLDHRVVEFAARLPLKMNYQNGNGKRLLREVLYRYVPRALVERPKMGFKVPVDTWLRGKLRPWAEGLLEPARLRREGFLAPDLIRQKWQEHIKGEQNWGGYLWPVLIFQAWQEYWLSSGTVIQ
jgi:asparagine synthase (glutamine-hydrolysing)